MPNANAFGRHPLKQLIQGRLIRFQNRCKRFRRRVLGYVVKLYQFAEFEMVGHHFWCNRLSCWKLLLRSVSVLLLALIKSVVMAEVFNPEFFQFEINGLAVFADNGDMTARFHDVLAHIPSRRIPTASMAQSTPSSPTMAKLVWRHRLRRGWWYGSRPTLSPVSNGFRPYRTR